MKTAMSRFHIHDELTAPEGSVPVLRGRARHRRPAPELPRRPRRLAGRAARVRALPLRAAPRHADAADDRAHRARRGRALPLRAGHRACTAAPPARPASGSTRSRSRASGTRATSARPRCCATSRRSSRASVARRCTSTRRRARPGWTDEQILEAIACTCDRDVHRDDQRRGRRPGRRLRRRTRGGCGRREPSPHRGGTLACHEPRGSGHRAPRSRARATPPPACCPYYHEAVELIGRRWTGAIVAVLLDGGSMRFSEISHAVPELSDRLLSERMKELEARGVVDARRRPRPAGQGRLRAHRHGPRRSSPRCRSSSPGRAAGCEPTQRRPDRPHAVTASPRACERLTAGAPVPGAADAADRPTASGRRSSRDVLGSAHARAAADRRRRQGARRGAQHPLHPLLVHRHPRPAEVVLDQRRRARRRVRGRHGLRRLVDHRLQRRSRSRT